MFNYPYGQSQELNLTWLLNAWRAYQSQIEDAIAPPYSDKVTYAAASLVWYDHTLYTNPTAIEVPEDFDEDHWEKTSIYEILSN